MPDKPPKITFSKGLQKEQSPKVTFSPELNIGSESPELTLDNLGGRIVINRDNKHEYQIGDKKTSKLDGKELYQLTCLDPSEKTLGAISLSPQALLEKLQTEGSAWFLKKK